MTEKPYQWPEGAKLPEHSRRKHKVVREYFADYLSIRCKTPQQTKFRLAIIDGFAGGGRYDCGSPGSPLIFIEELDRATQALNLYRAANGMAQLDIECLLVCNDMDRSAIELLETHVAPLEARIKSETPQLHLRVEYMNTTFEEAYPQIKLLLVASKYQAVLFNLDPCGPSHVERSTLVDILQSFQSVEVFYTFMIKSLVTFLHQRNPERLRAQFAPLGIDPTKLEELNGLLSKQEWLGTAERIVFETFKTCATYVSPFSIHNPAGWQYWLIHFANRPRARQAYNNTLHQNSTMQAHFGRSGLDMLVYDPRHDLPDLYLFDDPGRDRARRELVNDIPRLVYECGDVIPIEEFYATIYKATPAHSDDIHTAIMENTDLQVITPNGGERRSANAIAVGDVLKLKKQFTFFPMFSAPSDRRGK